jgi:sugar transferase (PEP-CTERM/EpsH1 system associated)
MKLLIICPALPYPTGGGSIRNYYLMKMLARKHSVSLLSLAEKAQLALQKDPYPFAEFVNSIKVVPRQTPVSKRLSQAIHILRGKSHMIATYTVAEMQAALDALLSYDFFDFVIFESAVVAGYHLPQNVKVIIDEHNIEHEICHRTYQHETEVLRKWYNWAEYRLLKPYELELCRRASTLLVTSERERCILKSMLPNSIIEVVPNGVDIESFQKGDLVQEVPGRIIFTGAMTYHANVEAVIFFARQCWPLIQAQIPGATWQIVGRTPPPEVQRLASLPGVTVTGSVQDIRPYLAKASVAIAPLCVGSGTRLKILEALAMRKAVVSTEVGCEGLAVESGKHLLVANQPEAFAQAVVYLLKNPEMRVQLGTAGRLLVEAAYTWEQSGNRLLRILEEVSQ